MTPTDCCEADTPQTRAAAPRRTAANSNNLQGTSTTSRAGNKPQTTLGSSLFVDPLAGAATVSEIRHRLELKYCACIATGGTNGFPLDVRRIKDTRLRALAGAGMTLREWTVQDLVRCSGNLEGHAGTILMATLERPVWGPDDFRLLDLIERMEEMRITAMRGGRML